MFQRHRKVCNGKGPENQRPRSETRWRRKNNDYGLNKIDCQAYYDKGHSLTEVSKQFGVGNNTVILLGLKTRNKHDAGILACKNHPLKQTEATKKRLSEVALARNRFWEKNLKSRSKNEMYFAELCAAKFDKVKCNEPLFNGWDADVIISSMKIAVLWNGIWHYRQVNKNHNLEHVKIRDKYKLENIIKCGYTPYIIKDMGSYKKEFVESEFNKFLKCTGA
jgi:hypothetical protein